MNLTTEQMIVLMQEKLARIQEQMINTNELVTKMAIANNHLIDVICHMSGIDPKDFIMARDHEVKRRQDNDD